jgi:phosphomannomutase
LKKIIVFDQDDTINITKLPMDPEMAQLMKHLLDSFVVCIISGTNWEVMKKNDIDTLSSLDGVNYWNYLIMPTTGTQFWHYVGDDSANLSKGQILDDGWKREYAYFLSEEQIAAITASIEEAAKKLGYWCESPIGEIIENRGSQITFSALGQWAAPEDKYAWDPDMNKRKEIVALIKPRFDTLGVQVRIGGATSIDVTLPDIDKAYGMRRLMEQKRCKKSDILFIGDKLQPGGNDYPVKALGIDTIEVCNAKETKLVIKGILGIIGLRDRHYD